MSIPRRACFMKYHVDDPTWRKMERSRVSQKIGPLFPKRYFLCAIYPFLRRIKILKISSVRLDPSSAVLSFEIKVSSLVWGKTTDTCTCFVFLKLMLEINNLYSKVLTHGFILLLGAKSLCRGFGYVTFALADDAQKAIDVVKTFGGRQLSVCFADKKPKHEKRKRKQGRNGEGDDYGIQSEFYYM